MSWVVSRRRRRGRHGACTRRCLSGRSRRSRRQPSTSCGCHRQRRRRLRSRSQDGPPTRSRAGHVGHRCCEGRRRASFAASSARRCTVAPSLCQIASTGTAVGESCSGRRIVQRAAIEANRRGRPERPGACPATVRGTAEPSTWLGSTFSGSFIRPPSAQREPQETMPGRDSPLTGGHVPDPGSCQGLTTGRAVAEAVSARGGSRPHVPNRAGRSAAGYQTTRRPCFSEARYPRCSRVRRSVRAVWATTP